MLSPGGLAQMAEGGLIDDTRIDLGQLDESNRSQPSTPLRRSPTGVTDNFPGKLITIFNVYNTKNKYLFCLLYRQVEFNKWFI